MVSKVYIQKMDGEIASDPCYTAWRGFRLKGTPIEFFQWPDLKQGRVTLAADLDFHVRRATPGVSCRPG